MFCTLEKLLYHFTYMWVNVKAHASDIEKFIETLQPNEIILNNSASWSGNQRDRKCTKSVLEVVIIHL